MPWCFLWLDSRTPDPLFPFRSRFGRFLFALVPQRQDIRRAVLSHFLGLLIWQRILPLDPSALFGRQFLTLLRGQFRPSLIQSLLPFRL
jgi:hypothetical protein